jgi:hypothetical protein
MENKDQPELGKPNTTKSKDVSNVLLENPDRYF